MPPVCRAMIAFAKPTFSDEDLDKITHDVRRILASGWLTSGPSVKKLESNFTELLGSKYCVAVNSCTAALHLLLLSLGIGRGDEVIVPTNTFVATANVVLYVGAKPVFADCDERTFNVSPEEVERRITNRTKAMIPVHLGGNPSDITKLTKVAESNGIALVEDCAHALGSRFEARLCGTFGVAGAFSFYATKVITAGEGGMIATDSKRIADACKAAGNHGRAGFGPLEIQKLGFNYRMPDMLAAVATNQLKHLATFVNRRNEIAKRYNSRLKKVRWLHPQAIQNNSSSSYYAYIVELVDSPLSRDTLSALLRKRGIETSVMYHPVHLQPFYRKMLGYKSGALPVAERLGKNSMALPMHSGLTDRDVDVISSEIIQIVEEC